MVVKPIKNVHMYGEEKAVSKVKKIKAVLFV